jgi:uncharacterized UBP type Zn finger protein
METPARNSAQERAMPCEHSDTIAFEEADDAVCKSCVDERLSWVALHLCTSCGHVGCCVSSPGKHAKKHHEQTGHPIIRSVEQDWRWCYYDKCYV